MSLLYIGYLILEEFEEKCEFVSKSFDLRFIC